MFDVEGNNTEMSPSIDFTEYYNKIVLIIKLLINDS